MNPDEIKTMVKQSLIEVIDDDGKRGRKWFFPQNVDNEYKVFANMTLKEIMLYILPGFAIAIGIGCIPPYNSVLFWIIKAVFIICLLTIPLLYVSYRPIKHRDNIRAKDFLKEKMDYKNKQKVYFLRPKDMPHK